ncbi:MAG TPA: YciI family protein [Mycobacteriales bacterium]|nr:YciI family protein [Mycobacteriales bacterium]
MRFLVMGKATADTEAGVLPTTEELEAMGAYVQELAAAGILLAFGGLRPSSAGARVRFSGGEPTVLDGPFAETKELVAGYMILEVSSTEEVIEWVKRSPMADGAEMEIRPLFEDGDFGDNETPEQREADTRLRAAVAEQHPGR